MSDMTVAADTTFARRHAFLEQAGLAAVYGVAGALQFSISIAQILLTIAFAVNRDGGTTLAINAQNASGDDDLPVTEYEKADRLSPVGP